MDGAKDLKTELTGYRGLRDFGNSVRIDLKVYNTS